MKTKQKGFTLIELLVVVAIIGILASVVLASLSSARNRGKDAAIKGAVSGAITQAEIVSNGSTYTTACVGSTGTAVTIPITTTSGWDATLVNMAANVSKNSGALTCTATANGIAVYSKLATVPTTAFCVDVNGYSGTLATAAPAAGPLALGQCQ